MSNLVTNSVKAAAMSPAQKAVLMCLADYAQDDGTAWPSIPAIEAWTCLKRTAVIEALKSLESRHLIVISRSTGQNNRMRVNLAMFQAANQSAIRTSPPSAPVRETDGHQSAKRTGVVRETDGTSPSAGPNTSIHQNTSKTPSKATAEQPLKCPADVAEQTWSDYLTLRKAKKAPVTVTVLETARRESEKAGMPLDSFLQVWCMRGSQGLQADWLKPSERLVQSRKTFTQSNYEEVPDGRIPA